MALKRPAVILNDRWYQSIFFLFRKLSLVHRLLFGQKIRPRNIYLDPLGTGKIRQIRQFVNALSNPKSLARPGSGFKQETRLRWGAVRTIQESFHNQFGATVVAYGVRLAGKYEEVAIRQTFCGYPGPLPRCDRIECTSD